jgi:hypothetical protein
MALGGWKIADELRRSFRRQEVPAGAIVVLLLAVATAAASYLYY